MIFRIVEAWVQRRVLVIFLFCTCFLLVLDYLDASADQEGPLRCARVRVNAPDSVSFFCFFLLRNWMGDMLG